jgi:Pyrroline-5-carboxylate reductase dimerisation
METGEHPAILRNSVTSPAGTTASAIYELEKGGLRPLGTLSSISGGTSNKKHPILTPLVMF